MITTNGPTERWYPLVALLVALLAFASCTTASAESETSAAQLEQHRQDLQRIQHEEFQRELWDAMQAAVQRCMEDRGVSYTPEPFFREPVMFTGLAVLPGESLDYGLDAWEPGGNPGFLDVTEEQVDALLGVGPQPGCFDVAHADDFVVEASLLRENVLAAEKLLLDILRVEPEYQRRLEQWSSCIADDGLDFADRERLYRWVVDQTAASRTETASTDRRCLEASGLGELIESYRQRHLGAAYASFR